MRQKWKTKWITDRDVAKMKLHVFKCYRRSRNAITRLEMKDGTILTKENSIEIELINFWKFIQQK